MPKKKEKLLKEEERKSGSADIVIRKKGLHDLGFARIIKILYQTANLLDDIRLNVVCKGEHFRNEIESKIQNNTIGKPLAKGRQMQFTLRESS